ncbi:MAG: hypothetical protein JSW65_04690, partial [Candidatus Bipolaricaulota bacterium]
MRKSLGVVLAAAVIGAIVFAVAQGSQPVPWSLDRPLAWSDYQGSPAPDDSPMIAARTHILLNYRYQYVSSYDSSAKR